jgi:hypothetical protein
VLGWNVMQYLTCLVCGAADARAGPAKDAVAAIESETIETVLRMVIPLCRWPGIASPSSCALAGFDRTRAAVDKVLLSRREPFVGRQSLFVVGRHRASRSSFPLVGSR